MKPFDKNWHDCKSFEDKFLYYFKNLPNFVEQPPSRDDHYFEELASAAEFSNMTKSEREAYNLRLKIRRDNENCDAFAREKAINEGHAIGLAKGLEEGRAEGHAEGHAEGRAESTSAIAEKCWKRDLVLILSQNSPGWTWHK